MLEDVIEVFVGCAANGEDAESCMVLEHSLRTNTTGHVNIHWMMAERSDPWSGWNMSTWATPFSGFRWSIPEVMWFQGKGIYMDSDMIVLSDLRKLWNQEFEPGKVVLSKSGSDGWRFCVCMWNNGEADMILPPLSDIKKEPTAHQQLMHQFSMGRGAQVVQPFVGNWNCIDGEDLDLKDIDILHYSDMSTQPHLRYAVPRLAKEGKKHWFDGGKGLHWRDDIIDCFDYWYDDALDRGYNVESYIPKGDWINYQKHSQADYDRYRNKWSR